MNASIDVPPQGDPAGKPTILVVEDEVLVRLDIAAYLRSKGFRVLEAGDAYEAIQLLQADHSIDLVFSDVSIPGTLNGLDLARWIRHRRAGVQILLTSGTPNKIELAARESTVMPKPYNPHDVETTIRKLLGL
jgi:CheY-like chemotaxis protein